MTDPFPYRSPAALRAAAAVIARIHPCGTRIGGLLAYLFGPGRKEDHARPRLAAAWEGAGDLAGLEPPTAGNGRQNVRALVAMLEDPLRAAIRAPRKPVWCTDAAGVTLTEIY